MKTLAVVLLVGASVAPAPPFRAETYSERSYDRARRVVDAAVAALGGAEGLRVARRFAVREAGVQYQLFQSARPEPPFAAWALEQRVAVDLTENRAVGEGHLRSSTSPYEWWTRTIVAGATGYDVNLKLRTAIPLASPSLADYPAWARRLPHNLLAEMLERAATLRSLGTDVDRGVARVVVTFAPARGPQLAVFFDAATHLPVRFESLFTSNVAGDTSVATVYKPYRDAGATKVPTGRTIYNAGYLWQDTDYLEVRLDERPSDDLFALPVGVAVQQAVDSEPHVTELAKDVYLLESLPDGFNVLFVAFDEFVLVAEAPESNVVSGLSERAIAMIRQRVGAKPIRYVVLTHHHGDHASGARAYVAAGATVVTTPGNRAFVERLASARFERSPDALALAPRRPAIETVVGGRREFRDATHEVVLYDIGPLDHAREMLIVHLPREKVVFQSDLFNPVGTGEARVEREAFYHGVARESTETLLRAVARLGLDVRVVAGSHGRVATFAELASAARRRRSGDEAGQPIGERDPRRGAADHQPDRVRRGEEQATQHGRAVGTASRDDVVGEADQDEQIGQAEEGERPGLLDEREG
jgi:glyoxylase-like metal-dependent hydrolase (beta-lactamase superfamily II)